MTTFKAFINYGVLGAEKRNVWTAEAPHVHAVCSDMVDLIVPEGWELYQNHMGDNMVTSPWGWDYSLNEVIAGNEDPYFIALDKDGNEKRVKLEVVKSEN